MSKTKPGEVVARGACFKKGSLQRVLRILVVTLEVGITFLRRWILRLFTLHGVLDDVNLIL